ncbi:hypothetical protein [Streptomyces sp. DH12]|uniref:hypothetical protein n=1 Tax=Streptomyces sp. DH12 TaxID=2857010 RepID=UPI001E313342|nr:hypothetical protein [Streptomyces sp. DH12]
MAISKPPLVLFRDGDDIRRDLRLALAAATDAERPGLERALTVVEAQCARGDDDVLAQWTRGVLEAAGVDPDRDHVKAVAAVRTAVPELSLLAAHRLVKGAAGGS